MSDLVARLEDALERQSSRGVRCLIREAIDELRRVGVPPTAGEILVHLEVGGEVERWHPWTGGGDWGCPHSSDELAWQTCPANQPQPGYRLRFD